jgi:galactokinase
VKATVRAQLEAAGMSAVEAAARADLFDRASDALDALGDTVSEERLGFFVPGRIEVLGKHTDYAGGRTLICSAEKGFSAVAAPRADRVVTLSIASHTVRRESFAIDRDLDARPGDWAGYAMSVARRLARNFGIERGADLAFASDLPSAAGMSSSSALVISVYLALAAVNRIDRTEEYSRNIRTPEELAGYLATMEKGDDFGTLTGDSGVGTAGGSEDHTAMLCAQPGMLSHYVFCPVRLERVVPLPEGYVFAIGVSGVQARKTGAARQAYNRISLAARRVLETWRHASRRDDPTLGEAVRSAEDLTGSIRQVLQESTDAVFPAGQLLDRFDHFVEESEHLVPEAGEALASGRMDRFGALVHRSQNAAERLLGNQVPETILLASAARSLGAVAASSFGAGFGGSV